MDLKVIEGTWEEIAVRSGEFAGCRVRLTVVDRPSSGPTLDHALAHLIEEAEKLTRSLPPSGSVAAEDWAQGITEKFRRQGFEL